MRKIDWGFCPDPVLFVDRQRWQCAWPADDSMTHCCGKPIECAGGLSYCAEHMKRVRGVGTKGERDALDGWAE